MMAGMSCANPSLTAYPKRAQSRASVERLSIKPSSPASSVLLNAVGAHWCSPPTCAPGSSIFPRSKPRHLPKSLAKITRAARQNDDRVFAVGMRPAVCQSRLARLSFALHSRWPMHLRQGLRQERWQASARERRFQGRDHRTLDRSRSGGANGQMPTSELRPAPFPGSWSLMSTVRKDLRRCYPSSLSMELCPQPQS